MGFRGFRGLGFRVIVPVPTSIQYFCHEKRGNLPIPRSGAIKSCHKNHQVDSSRTPEDPTFDRLQPQLLRGERLRWLRIFDQGRALGLMRDTRLDKDAWTVLALQPGNHHQQSKELNQHQHQWHYHCCHNQRILSSAASLTLSPQSVL